MKIKFIPIIVLLLLFGQKNILSQNSFSCDTVNKLKSFFDFDHEYLPVITNEVKPDIPINFIKQILGDTLIIEKQEESDFYVVSVTAEDIFKKKDATTFIVELNYPMGGYSSNIFMFSISNKNCLLLKIERIGFNLLDAEGGYSCTLKMINDSILDVLENEEYHDKDCTNNTYSYYIINNYGFQKINISKPSKGRKYPQSSERILKKAELIKMNKDNLDIMRNEIFADYGYIFKSKKWKDYFEKQDWYNPRYKDVTNKLTVIEKINIESILKISPIKHR